MIPLSVASFSTHPMMQHHYIAVAIAVVITPIL